MSTRLLLWLAPDLALVVSSVALFYCLFLPDGPAKLFRDSDTGWHIRIGESLAKTGLPHEDPFSFSRPGATWFAWEWGADALMGLAHAWDGLRGVALLFGVAIGAVTWLWFRLQWMSGGDFLIACVMAAPMLSTVSIHWLARPHVFGWLLLLVAILAAESGVRHRAHLAAAFLLGVLWANVHASFFLGALVALVYAAAHLLRPLIWDLPAAKERRQAGWFAAAAAAYTAGTLLNPYGVHLHIHVARYLADTELLARVGEFQSFNFHVEGAGQIVLTMMLAAAGGIGALAHRRLDHALLIAIFAVGALRSARGLPLVALVGLPLANGAITAALTSARDLSPALRRVFATILGYSARLRRLDAGMGGLALVPLLIAAAWAALYLPAAVARTNFPPDQFPVEAARAIEPLSADARILAPDKFGGYLIYRFAGSRKVFFDGRSDFYGSAFMKEYIRLVEVRPGWEEQLSRWRFTHALLPVQYSLIPALERLGWRRLYQDQTAVLLVRP